MSTVGHTTNGRSSRGAPVRPPSAVRSAFGVQSDEGYAADLPTADRDAQPNRRTVSVSQAFGEGVRSARVNAESARARGASGNDTAQYGAEATGINF